MLVGEIELSFFKERKQDIFCQCMVHRPIFTIRRWYRCKFFAIYFWCIITTIHWIQFTTKFQQGQNLERSLLFKLNGWTLILHFRTRKSAPFNFSVMKLLTKGQRSVWSILPIKRRGTKRSGKTKRLTMFSIPLIGLILLKQTSSKIHMRSQSCI